MGVPRYVGRYGLTHIPGVEGGWIGHLIVGGDPPVVLPTPSVGGVVLATWWATGDDGLSRSEINHWVWLDGIRQAKLCYGCEEDEYRHGAAGHCRVSR